VKGVLQDENKEIDDAEKLARSAADQQLRQQLAAQRTKEDNEFKSQLTAALQAPTQSIDSARNALQLAEKLQNRGVRDAMVVNARRDIQNKLLAQIRATNEKSGPDAAIRFAEQASALMPESTVLLGQIVELRKLGAERQAQTRLAAIATIKAEIDALAKTPKLDDRWWRDSQAAFRRLAAYLPDTDPYVLGVKRNMANAYIAAARKSRDAKSLSEAERMIELAAQLSPTHPELEGERKLLADARALQGKVAQQAKQTADTDALKQRLRDQAKADDTEFLATLKNLKQTLPENDAFLTTEAPFVIAESYQRLASKAARGGNYETAVTLIDRGLENASGLRALRDARARYVALKDLSAAISTGSNLSARDLKAGLDAVQKADPVLGADVQKRFKAALDSRIRAEQGRNATLASNYDAISSQVWPDTAGSPARPAAAAVTPPAARTTSSPSTGPSTVAASGTSQQQTTAPTAVQASASEAGGAAVVPAAMTSTVAPKPCRAELAGKGTRSQAVCYDVTPNGRGPDLVVLPAGGPFSGPVAVMRYELTNEDYNFYCTTTGRCKTVSAAPKLPIVSISAAEAERYANWLSEASGKVYRLPADAEWTYIATGIPDGADFNCTMEVGGQKVKGYALAEKNSGTPSKWGVYNVIGNAQEWARAPGGWVARGGAFSDNVTNCGVALGRAHSGSPDGKTGLRLVREF
jgi:formylglycine-generating enzyme required for sulfatase activity